jgi:hypothetical protein
MDPSKTQPGAEDSNDKEGQSLEGTDTVVESGGGDTKGAAGKAEVTDATTQGAAPAPSAAKLPLLKRIWQRFNIYLLLFLLTLLVFVGITVLFYLRNNQAAEEAKEIIDSQTLSQEAADQLAGSSITVGSSKQVLNVGSNAIFSGSVLVRSDLEVAGKIKFGGNLELPGLIVTGPSTFTQLQTVNLSVTADAVVQGSFTVRRGMSVLGTSTFGNLSAAQISANTLQLNGPLTLTNHIAAGGPIPSASRGTALGSGGTASVDGSDLAGSITINTGGGPGAGCFINVTFVRKYDNTPRVIVTPIGSGAAAIDYYVNRSTTGFSVCATNAAPANETFGFDYIIFG